MSLKTTYTTGRRKTSSARVYLSTRVAEEAKDGQEGAQITVNGRPFADYFPRKTAQMLIMQPLEMTEKVDAYTFTVRVAGGGSSGQAGAVRHGISRALEKIDPSLRGLLKKAGFLTRDSRIVERKKPGRHKARKRPQFSKR